MHYVSCITSGILHYIGWMILSMMIAEDAAMILQEAKYCIIFSVFVASS